MGFTSQNPTRFPWWRAKKGNLHSSDIWWGNFLPFFFFVCLIKPEFLPWQSPTFQGKDFTRVLFYLGEDTALILATSTFPVLLKGWGESKKHLWRSHPRDPGTLKHWGLTIQLQNATFSQHLTPTNTDSKEDESRDNKGDKNRHYRNLKPLGPTATANIKHSLTHSRPTWFHLF